MIPQFKQFMCEISQMMFSTKCEIFYFMKYLVILLIHGKFIMTDYLMLTSYSTSDARYKFVLVYEDKPIKSVALRSS